MTAGQLPLGECDPAWDDLCDLGAELLEEPADPRHPDLRGQGLTAIQMHTIADVHVVGEYL